MSVTVSTLAEVRAARTPVPAAGLPCRTTGAYRLGHRFGVQSLRVDAEIDAWLAEVEARVAASADPAVQETGRMFLAGVRAALGGAA